MAATPTPAAIVFENVVCVDGDDFPEFEAVLYPGSTPEDLANGILMGPPDIQAAFAHLCQYEDGDGRDAYQGPGVPWGTSDEVVWFDVDGQEVPSDLCIHGYVMGINTGLSYATLYRYTR